MQKCAGAKVKDATFYKADQHTAADVMTVFVSASHIMESMQ